MKYGINILLVFEEQWMLAYNHNVYEMLLDAWDLICVFVQCLSRCLFHTSIFVVSEAKPVSLLFIPLHITPHTHWYLNDTNQ